MSDLISRQAVENITWEEPSYTDPLNVLTEVREKVRALPSVENKGEWIKVQSGDKDFPESIVCSKCRNENSHFDFNEHAEPIGKVFVTSKFCPNCGADMRGKSENDEKDFPQTEDIEPTVKNFSKVLDNKLIRDTIQDCEQI